MPFLSFQPTVLPDGCLPARPSHQGLRPALGLRIQADLRHSGRKHPSLADGLPQTAGLHIRPTVPGGAPGAGTQLLGGLWYSAGGPAHLQLAQPGAAAEGKVRQGRLKQST